MFKTIGVETFDQLIYETIPENIRLKNDLQLEPAMTEYEYSQHIHELGKKNKIFKSYIGLGYHPSIVPAVIQRNIFENPGWYTAYTPYQAEIAQGRLEAILNFQTTVIELTGMEIANASLLDESTAAAEAMALLFDVRTRDQKKNNTNKFFVSEEILPQTLSVLQTRSTPIGVELVIGNHETFDFSTEFFGAILQYPGKFGQVNDYSAFIAKAKEQEIKVKAESENMIERTRQECEKMIHMARMEAQRLIDEDEIKAEALEHAKSVHGQVMAQIEEMKSQSLAEVEHIRKETLEKARDFEERAYEKARQIKYNADRYAEEVLSHIDSSISELQTVSRSTRRFMVEHSEKDILQKAHLN
jgi:hypothetical protein